MIYFDNAATTGKKPASVISAVNNAMIKYSANPGRSGHTLSVSAAEAVYGIRQKISDFFGAQGADRVCFTLNCTHSINCVIKGVLKRGDRILISSLEHNAVMRPAVKTGAGIDVAEVSLYDDEKTLKEFENKIRPNTRLVFCTAASNVLGKTLPIKRIGELCRKRGVLFGVDAAQSAGVFPIDMNKMNIDYLCIAPHKGLYAPMGIGILICNKDIDGTIIEGGTGTNSIEFTQPHSMPEKLESGTINLPAIMGIGAGIDFLKSKGIQRLYEHEITLIDELYKGLSRNPNIILYTREPKKNGYAPVLSFNLKGLNSNETSKILSDSGFAVRGGLHCAPTAHKAIGTLENGTVRVSVGYFNTADEIRRLIQLLSSEKMLKKVKKSIE